MKIYASGQKNGGQKERHGPRGTVAANSEDFTAETAETTEKPDMECGGKRSATPLLPGRF
jgi:hypothetical protein